MTHLDPDPLYVAEGSASIRPAASTSGNEWEVVVYEAMRRYHLPSDSDARTAEIAIKAIRGHGYRVATSGDAVPRMFIVPAPERPSLTIPLVLLCAVVGAVFVAWLVTR